MFTPAQLAAEVTRLNKSMGDLAEQQELYRASLTDPSYQAFTAWLREETRLAQDTYKVEKQLADLRERESLLSTGILEKQLLRQNQLRAQGVDLARQENLLAAEARRNYLASGAYSQQVLGNQPANRINQQSDHSQQLIERYAAAALRSEAIRTGDFHMQARANESTARFERHNVVQESRITQTVRNEGRRDDLGSGFTRHEALADARVRLESDKLSRQEARVNRSALLEAKYGSTIGKVVQAGESTGTRAVFGAVGSIGDKAYGMAMSGFSNTVEMNQFNREMHLISRELAATLAPALKGVTGAAKGVREWFSKLSGSQQDAIEYGTLGILGLKGASMASHRVLGMGLLEAGGAAAAWYQGPGPGGPARTAPANRLQGMPPVVAPVPGGGAAKGGSTLASGAKSAGMFGLWALAIAGTVDTAMKVESAYNSSEDHQSTYSKLRNQEGAGPLSGKYSGFGAAITTGLATLTDHFMMLDKWNSVVGKDWHIKTATEMLTEGRTGADGTKLDANGHRVVTPADVGYGAVGSSYERLSQATDMVLPQDELVEAMNKLADVIRAQNPDRAPPPEAGT